MDQPRAADKALPTRGTSRNRTSAIVLTFALLGVPFAVGGSAQGLDAPGSLITSFDGDGYVLTNIGGGTDAGQGETCPTYGNADGFWAPTADSPVDSEFAADGGLVVAGVTHHTAYQEFSGPAQSPDLFLAKYLPNGELDPSFGTDGVVIQNYGTWQTVTGQVEPNMDCVGGMALDSEGRILVSMTHQEVGQFGSYYPAPKLLRFTSSGDPDTTFDGDGWVDLPNTYMHVGDVEVTADDAALMLTTKLTPNWNGPGETLLRFSSDGVLDAGFSVPPLGASAILDGIRDFSVLPDGKILTLGRRGYDAVVWRLTSSGAPDQTYGEGGAFFSDFADTPNVHLVDLAAGPDGEATATGWHGKGGGTGDDYAVLRVSPAGQADTSFSQDGYLELAPSDVDPATCLAHEYPHTLDMDDQGRTLIVGQYWPACDADPGYVVYRLLPDGTPDPSFNGDGKAPGEFPDPDMGCPAYYSQFRVARDASLDPATGRFGIASTIGIRRDCTTPRVHRADLGITMMNAGGSLDSTPPTGTISVAGGQPATASRSVALTLSATDQFGVTEMRLRNAGQSWEDWRPFTTSASWTLADADGSRSVEVEYRDKHGNVSTTYSDTIVLDRVAPDGVSVAVNGNAAWSTSTSVSVSIVASDAAPSSGLSLVRFRTGDGAWSAWSAYASSKSWTLPASDGQHTVQMQVQDGAGNVASASDSIGLDRTGPGLTVSVNGGALATRSPGVSVKVSATDAGSGATQVRLRDTWHEWTSWQPMASPLPWQLEPLDGQHTVSIQVRDSAGNVSVVRPDSILLDRIRPRGSFKINGGAATTSTRAVTLSLSGRDPDGSGVSQVRIKNGSGAWSAWRTYRRSVGWQLPPGRGTKVVWVQYRDRAGNVSLAVKDSITFRP